jgi:DNA-binding CsgD family transcriptional regulator/tetratricopeptide (TPR) repeat protein
MGVPVSNCEPDSLGDNPRIVLLTAPIAARILVGRDRERQLLAELIDSLNVGGSATVILGEPGMGKTSLLKFVSDYAERHGASVRFVRGIEAEAALPFAAIADLLMPLRVHMAKLPAVQREALEVCLALSAESPRGPLAACVGTLGILSAAAAQHPVVVLVDDFQWLDAESAQILLFVARRVVSERLAIVFTVRAEPDAPPPNTGLPFFFLGGLSAEECAELAAARGGSLTPQVCRSLVESTGGNPLAIVENLRMPGGGDLAGRLSGAETVGLHQSLDQTWGRLFDQLPQDTRVALFVVVADHDAAGRHTVEALKSLGLSLSSLRPAERLNLIAHSADGIRLRHPLLRSVVISRTQLADKAAGYHALAEAADGYSRSWYLAAAANGPNETVATGLVAAADEARRRDGLSASARTLHRAAELTADPSAQAERLLQAAHDAHLAGDSRSATAWCEQALRLRNDPSFSADVQRVTGAALTWLGEPRQALEGMTAAADRLHSSDPARAARILAEATAPAGMLGQVQLARDLAESVEHILEGSAQAAEAATSPMLAMLAEAFVRSGDIDRATSRLEGALNGLRSSNLAFELQGAATLSQALSWCERYSDARQVLTMLLQAARGLASPTVLSVALGISSEIGWWSGQWTAAYADASEATHLAEENGQPGLLGYGLSMMARIEAARGERESCQARVERGRRELEPRGIGCLPIYSLAALGLAALSVGDLSAAAVNLQKDFELSIRVGLGNPNVVPMAGDLVETLARERETASCERILEWLDERSEATGLAYPRAVACRARGILATDAGKAQSLFAESLAALDLVGPVPFEQARTLLCSGEVLRRARWVAAAREPLERAAALFDNLGARPWAARARAELTASGVKDQLGTHASARLKDLTPQELQVARIAGRGRNNIEVAAALFMSRKTVEAHLTRVYRKLEIRSRTDLARMLLANGIAD